MKRNFNQKNLINLYQAILALESEKEAQNFLRDLLTKEEINEFSKRWQAAQMLNMKVPYTEIEKKTGLSSTTVARVSKWLKQGKGGYRLILKRLNRNWHHISSSVGKELMMKSK